MLAQRSIFMRTRSNSPVRAIIASVVALLMLLVMVVPTFALTNPAFVCEIDANGTSTSYITNSGSCAGHTLVDSNHQTLVMMIIGACDSTSVFSDQLVAAINGDFMHDYFWSSYNGTPNYSPADNRLDLGQLPCNATGTPAHAAGSIYVKIPMSFSTVFDKQVETQDAFWGADGAGGAASFYQIVGGAWHRSSVGAITVVWVAMRGGSKLISGSKIAFYQE